MSSPSSPRSTKPRMLDRWSFLLSQLFQSSDSSSRINPIRLLFRVLSLVLFFGIWQFLCAIKFQFFINFAFLPSPVEVLSATLKFFSNNPMVHI